MNYYNKLAGNILLPISDRITGWGVSKSLKFLRESQYWSETDLINYQTDKLKQLINHAFNNVPYYTDLFRKNGLTPADIQEIEDLRKIPTLTKELIMENFNNGRLLSRKLNKKKVLLKLSSGSTGQKTVYYIDNEAYGFNLACNLRGWEWMGFEIGDSFIKVSQNKRNSKLKKIQDFLNHSYLFTKTYDEEGFDFFLQKIIKYNIQYIRSYPDPLLFLSHFMKRKGIKLTKSIKGINTTGNTLYSDVRELIESTFNTKIFDSYSCEGGPNYFECPTHSCYHSSMEYGISEILNSRQEEVSLGERGRLITTDLWNYATPFIRYESKDIVIKSDTKCSCGRNLLNIKGIVGRDNDIIIAPNSKLFIGQSFTTYFKYFTEIEYFHVYQKSEYEFIFSLKVKPELSSKTCKNIIDDWENYLGKGSCVDIKIIDNIPLLPSGKRRFLSRDSSIKLKL